jgi:signal peptidase II
VKEKSVQLNKKPLISLLIVFVCFFLDRLSKIYIINFFIENNFQNLYINSYLNFDLIWNKGIAFGLFQTNDFFYDLISIFIILVILFVIYLAFISKNISELVCYSLIIGGAFGNLFDRIYYKAVPDFIDLHFKNFHWFTFNVSDICISAGVLFLVLFDIFKTNEKNNHDKII